MIAASRRSPSPGRRHARSGRQVRRSGRDFLPVDRRRCVSSSSWKQDLAGASSVARKSPDVGLERHCADKAHSGRATVSERPIAASSILISAVLPLVRTRTASACRAAVRARGPGQGLGDRRTRLLRPRRPVRPPDPLPARSRPARSRLRPARPRAVPRAGGPRSTPSTATPDDLDAFVGGVRGRLGRALLVGRPKHGSLGDPRAARHAEAGHGEASSASCCSRRWCGRHHGR